MDKKRIMRREIKPLSLLCAILFAGCGITPTGEDGVRKIACDEFNMAEGIQDKVSSVEYLVLDLPQGCVLGGMDKVIVSESGIYVGDYQSQKIFVFDTDGKMRSVLDRRGRGPGEYVQIQSFSVDKGKIYVLDQFEMKVLTYEAETLEYLRMDKSPVPAWDFCALHDDGFLFAYAPMEGNPVQDRTRQYRVVVTDKNMHIRDRYYPYAKDEVDAARIAPYLSENADVVVYGSFREDGLSLFDRNDGCEKESLVFNFTKPIPDGERSFIKDIMEGGYTFLTSVPHRCGNYYAINLSVKGQGQLCVYDMAEAQVGQQSKGTMRNMLLGIIGGDGSCLIGNWRDKSIYEYMTGKGFKRAEPEEEAAILAGTPFLVFYRMQE